VKRLALVLLLCTTLAGCARSDATSALTDRIEAEGYRAVVVSHRDDHQGLDLLKIRSRNPSGPGDRTRIAEIAWDTYPEHVDAIEVAHLGETDTFSADDLRARFGERQVTEWPDEDSSWTWLFGLLPAVGIAAFLTPFMWRSLRKAIRRMRGLPPVSRAGDAPAP